MNDKEKKSETKPAEEKPQVEAFDPMPGDLTGSEIHEPSTGAFRFVSGPLFHDAWNPLPAMIDAFHQK